MPFPRTTLGLLAGLAVAGVVAWTLSGQSGTGVALGYLLGATLVAFGTAWQGHWLRVRPERALSAQLEAFLAKVAALMAAALAFRFLAPLAEVCDWKAFVVAYAAAVGLGLPLGSLDVARRLGRGRARGRESLEQRSAL